MKLEAIRCPFAYLEPFAGVVIVIVGDAGVVDADTLTAVSAWLGACAGSPS